MHQETIPTPGTVRAAVRVDADEAAWGGVFGPGAEDCFRASTGFGGASPSF